MEKIFEIKNLNVKFPLSDSFLNQEKGFIYAVNGISLDIYKNEIISLVGESGCGKSTLARTILGLEQATFGEILFSGADLNKLSKKELKNFRKKCQLVFQNPFSSLNPRMSIYQILKEPLIVNGIKSKNEINEKIKKALKLVGLDESIANRFPHEFSGGQRQRIAIARALILEPEIIVADEPVSALDVSIQAQIINLLLELKEKLNLTIIFISHDLSVVNHISDRVAVMYLGKIVELATKEELFANPLHPYTQALLSAVPKIETQQTAAKKITLEGDPPSVKNLPQGCYFASRCKIVQPNCFTTYPTTHIVTPTHYVDCCCVNKL